MPSRSPGPRRWLAAAGRPLHIAIGAVGPALAVFNPHLVWTIPLAIGAYGAMVVRAANGGKPAPVDPLAPAAPEIDWIAIGKTIESTQARSLIDRLEQIDLRITRLTREAPDSTQGVLVAALVQVRDVARTGVALSRGINRIEVLLRSARPELARAEASALDERASRITDALAAEALRAAARQRAAYARRADGIAVMHERMKAESEELLAQLEHAAFNAEWTAARTAVFERVRADATLLQETLAELDALDPNREEGFANPPPERAPRLCRVQPVAGE